jgi:hypothetical protein
MSLTTTQSAVSMKFAGHLQRVGVPESLGVAALEQQRLDLMSGSGLTVRDGYAGGPVWRKERHDEHRLCRARG